MENNYVHRENERALTLLSVYLNLFPDCIDADMVNSITGGDESTRDYAFSVLMATACGLDTLSNGADKELFRQYFVPMVKWQDAGIYRENPYYKRIGSINRKNGAWELRTMTYKPYEAFVYDDITVRADGRLLPRIGYFTEPFEYTAVLEQGREWMTVTPNEINNMRHPISEAFGDVLTFGLGIGYYAYMVSRKANVSSVTVVERDERVIELFKSEILPLFEHKDKIRIVKEDAFIFADRELPKGKFDFVFTDIWHDPSDGVELYLRMKEKEKICPKAKFEYWIEKTLRIYIGE